MGADRISASFVAVRGPVSCGWTGLRDLDGSSDIFSGFLFVCNHRSAFDPILEMGIFRKYRLGFVSKEDNLKIPVIGKIMHQCSCIALDRENPRRAIETITHAAQTIRFGSAVMGIYPEGTRNPSPEKGLLPFKPGAFKIAQKAGCPIVVAVIQNTESILKNAPLRKTRVQVKIVGVLDEDTVKRNSTMQISEMVRGMMEEAMLPLPPACGADINRQNTRN